MRFCLVSFISSMSISVLFLSNFKLQFKILIVVFLNSNSNLKLLKFNITVNTRLSLLYFSVGRVLFERNVAFSFRDSTWRRCKSKDLMLTPLTPVKMHVRVLKLKWQRRNQVTISFATQCAAALGITIFSMTFSVMAYRVL
jgi:hypothetical protein